MCQIRYSIEFQKDYKRLKERAEKGNSEARYLLDLISNATIRLMEDIEFGDKVPRRLWPKEYIRKHDIKNLWRYALDSYWRLIYTVSDDKVNLFVIYLDCMTHKKYDRKFKYKTS